MDKFVILCHIFCILFIQGHVNSTPIEEEQKNNELTHDEYVEVNTASGKIRGQVYPAVGKEGKILKFLGIPYAEKPIGNHRFLDPLPTASWEGTLDALHHGNPCYHPIDKHFEGFPGADMWNPTIPLHEDCLYLNVWAPYPTPNNASVMVWIHGGGFAYGTSSLWIYDGEILASHTDIIVVSFNYRLGAFGFLASGDDRIKGNFGMKDQVLALQWVKDNIANFGGNPESVTLFGDSAGASSVGYHLMSPLSKNLFQKAIMQSGIPGANYAFSTNDRAKFHFKNLLSYVDCPNDENVMSCLHQVPAEKLNNFTDDSWGTVDRISVPFLPVIDGDFLKEDPIFSTDKNNFKKVPMLLSVNKNEATYFLLYHYPKSFHKDNDSCISRSVFSEIIDDFYKDLSPSELEFVKYLYTDWTDSTSPIKNRDALDEIIGDREFNCPMHHFVEHAREYNPDIYLTEFNYRASIEVWPEWMGCYHSAELQFLFGHPFNRSKGYSEIDRMVSQRMMTYWSNFAKYGNPNGDRSQESDKSKDHVVWPALHHKHQHLEMTDELKIGEHFKDDQCQFWNEVLPALAHLSGTTH